MSESKHTKGPWKVTEHTGARWLIADATGDVIASVNGPADLTAANARLIAVAPELFEALKGLLDGNPPGKVEFHVTEFDLQRARAVVAKVEGR